MDLEEVKEDLGEVKEDLGEVKESVESTSSDTTNLKELLRVGTIIYDANLISSANPKLLPCEGGSFSPSAYPELYNEIGVKYGGAISVTQYTLFNNLSSTYTNYMSVIDPVSFYKYITIGTLNSSHYYYPTSIDVHIFNASNTKVRTQNIYSSSSGTQWFNEHSDAYNGAYIYAMGQYMNALCMSADSVNFIVKDSNTITSYLGLPTSTYARYLNMAFILKNGIGCISYFYYNSSNDYPHTYLAIINLSNGNILYNNQLYYGLYYSVLGYVIDNTRSVGYIFVRNNSNMEIIRVNSSGNVKTNTISTDGYGFVPLFNGPTLNNERYLYSYRFSDNGTMTTYPMSILKTNDNINSNIEIETTSVIAIVGSGSYNGYQMLTDRNIIKYRTNYNTSSSGVDTYAADNISIPGLNSITGGMQLMDFTSVRYNGSDYMLNKDYRDSKAKNLYLEKKSLSIFKVPENTTYALTDSRKLSQYIVAKP